MDLDDKFSLYQMIENAVIISSNVLFDLLHQTCPYAGKHMIYLNRSGWRKFLWGTVGLQKDEGIGTGIRQKKNINSEAWYKSRDF